MFDAKFGSIAVTHTSFLGPMGYGTYYMFIHAARVGLVDSTLKGAYRTMQSQGYNNSSAIQSAILNLHI